MIQNPFSLEVTSSQLSEAIMNKLVDINFPIESKKRMLQNLIATENEAVIVIQSSLISTNTTMTFKTKNTSLNLSGKAKIYGAGFNAEKSPNKGQGELTLKSNKEICYGYIAYELTEFDIKQFRDYLQEIEASEKERIPSSKASVMFKSQIKLSDFSKERKSAQLPAFPIESLHYSDNIKIMQYDSLLQENFKLQELFNLKADSLLSMSDVAIKSVLGTWKSVKNNELYCITGANTKITIIKLPSNPLDISETNKSLEYKLAKVRAAYYKYDKQKLQNLEEVLVLTGNVYPRHDGLGADVIFKSIDNQEIKLKISNINTTNEIYLVTQNKQEEKLIRYIPESSKK
jgi:hypothetical protein